MMPVVSGARDRTPGERSLAAPCLAMGVALVLAACRPGVEAGEAPGTAAEGFTGIGPEETISYNGTEPFWGGTIRGSELTYSTPDNIEGTRIIVRRFTGQGGLGFSGAIEGTSFDLLITQGDCSDGMSDRTYPFVATLRLGGEQRTGCAHTDRQPFSGPAHP